MGIRIGILFNNLSKKPRGHGYFILLRNGLHEYCAILLQRNYTARSQNIEENIYSM